MHAVRVLDSLAVNRYNLELAVVNFLDTGSYRFRPDDSAHLAPYSLPVKTLLLDGGGQHNFATVSEAEYGRFFASNIDVAKSVPSFVFLQIDSCAADSARGLMVVKLAVDSTPPGADLRLLGILTEDSVLTYSRASFRIYFDKVARGIVPDYAGKHLPALSRGDTLYDTLRFTNPGWKTRHLGAALMVMDANSHQVLQAARLSRFQ